MSAATKRVVRNVPTPTRSAARPAGIADTYDMRLADGAGKSYIELVPVTNIDRTTSFVEGKLDHQRIILTLPAGTPQAVISATVTALGLMWKDAHKFGVEAGWDKGFDEGWALNERQHKTKATTKRKDDTASITAIALANQQVGS